MQLNLLLKKYIPALMGAFSVTASYGQVFIPVSSAPSNNKNFVLTRHYRAAGVTTNVENTIRPAKDVSQTVQYLDGLGRPLQSINIQGSPSFKDVIQPVQYDAYGKESRRLLPYVSAGTADGSYKSDALLQQPAFYNPTGSSGSQQLNGIVRTTYPFSESGIERSPLNRVIEQGAAGQAWQLPTAGTGDPNSNGHTLKTEYRTNDQAAFNSTLLVNNPGYHVIYKYTVTAYSNQSRTWAKGTAYPTGELYLTVYKNENWKPGDGCIGTTEEYKNKNGQVIARQTYNLKNGVVERLPTYYLYDELGNLCFVLPSACDPAGSPTQAKVDTYGYQYRYDTRNRLTQKRLPGKGWEFMIYNKLDQVVMTQDSVQRVKSPQQMTFTKYDVFGRVIMTGIWIDNLHGNQASISIRADVQTIADAAASWEDRDINNAVTGYTNQAAPQSSIGTYLSVNYYDKYTGIPGFPSPYNSTSYTSTPTGLITAKKINVLGTSNMLWMVNYYDEKGRLARTFAQHYLGGSTKLSFYNYDDFLSDYNFSDQPTVTTRKHYVRNTGGTAAVLALTSTDTLKYDQMGRETDKISVLQYASQAAQAPVIVSRNEYNEVGQLKSKFLHSIDNGGNWLQHVDYRYNERGWLTSINNSSLTSDGGFTNNDSNDKFGMDLSYDLTGSARPQYNGNIARVKWKQAPAGNTSPVLQTYDYDYDRINRLTSAVSSTVTAKDGLYNEALTYDDIGNIKTLGRYEKASGSGRTQIDTLTYTYSGNKLTRVDDASSYVGTAGFNDAVKQANEYTYDGNGNMLKDLNKTITAMSYNILNLPQTVTVNGSTLTFTYDASCRKLSKVFTGQTTLKTEYIGGIQYSDGVIDFIQTEEGRARLNGTVYKYEYDLKDHLGNTRNTLTWDANDATQLTVKVLQENDYYPFGLTIKSLEPLVVMPKNEYLYNGKELQEETGQYDYGARFYDPVIARWSSVDPLTEADKLNSPYSYVYNNPLRFIDPDGRIGDLYNLNDEYIGTDGIDDNKIYQVNTNSDQILSTQDAALYTSMASNSAFDNFGLTPYVQYLGKAQDVFVTGDPVTDKNILTLHPAARMKATNFINAANEVAEGVGNSSRYRIVSGLRTFQEQDELFAQGRTKSGLKVTNAKGGQSNHNYGMAFDIVGIDKRGRATYNLTENEYSMLLQMANSERLKWGGNWKTFKDLPHYEHDVKMSLKMQLQMITEGKTHNGYINLK